MPRQRRQFTARITLPTSGKTITLRAHTDRALNAYRHAIDTAREELRLNMRTPEEVDRSLHRVMHGVVRLERAANAYLARADLAVLTIRRVRSFVAGAGSPLLGLDLYALDAPTLDRWIGGLRGEETTIKTQWRTLRAIVRYAALRGWVGSVPWGAWRPDFRRLGRRSKPQREAARSVDELARIVTAARELDAEDHSPAPDREAKILTTAILGLRQRELGGLRWSDLDEARSTVRVEKQVGGRGPKAKRVVELTAEPILFEVLGEHRTRLERASLYAPGGPIFVSRTSSSPGRPHGYEGGEVLSRRAMRACVARAGLPNVQRWSAHSLRDTFVTLEAHAHQGDLAAVADRSRHASIASLVRYLRSRQRAPAAPGFTLGDAIDSKWLPPAAATPPAGRSIEGQALPTTPHQTSTGTDARQRGGRAQ